MYAKYTNVLFSLLTKQLEQAYRSIIGYWYNYTTNFIYYSKDKNSVTSMTS